MKRKCCCASSAAAPLPHRQRTPHHRRRGRFGLRHAFGEQERTDADLPQKEFLLLYKLLSYPDKIFTRIQLMDEIWGADCDTGWETVTVHIGRLRKRFEGWDDFEIISVRGLGYKAVKLK